MRRRNKSGRQSTAVAAAWLLLLAMVASPLQARGEEVATAVAGPVNLLQVINDALLASPQLQSARAEYATAKQLLPETRARLYPQLSLFGTADWVRDSVEGDYYGLVSFERSDTYPRYVYGATLRQSVFSGPLLAALDQSEQRVARAKAEAERKQESLLLNVADAYFALLAVKDRERIAGIKLRTLRQQAEQVSGRAAAGLALDAELKTAQAGAELASAEQLTAQTQVEAAFAVLESFTGKAYRELLPLAANASLKRPQPDEAAVWTERAARQNLDVTVRALELEVAKLEAERLRRGRWPQLDLVGSVYEIDNGGGISGERDEGDQRIGLAATLPLFTGGRLSAEIERGVQQVKRAEADLAAARAQAEREAKVAWLNLSAGTQRIQALQKAVSAARAAEEANRAGFEVGTRTNAEVLDAIEQLAEAETNLSGARYKFIIDSLHLKSAAGALLNADLAQINRLLRAESAAAKP